MNIGIDTISLLQPMAGLGRYTFNIIRCLLSLDERHNLYLFGGNNFFKEVFFYTNGDIESEIWRRVFVPPFPFKKITRVLLPLWAKKVELSRADIDVFLGTSFKGIFDKSFKTVVTVHDMVHEYYPETIPSNMLRYLRNGLSRCLERSHLVIAVSDNTKKDIVKFLGVPNEKVWVIYNGIDEIFRPVKEENKLKEIRWKYNLPDKFLLYIGAIQPRKNIVGIIKAFKLLFQDRDFDHKLVIGGGTGWKKKDIYTIIKELELKERVVFTPYIPDKDLPYIYNLADVFVFPSFYEGFGFPVLEAMACGVPVVTSDISCLPEIAGDAAVLVNPNLSVDIAEGIRMVISDEEFKKALVERGLKRSREFTWKRCVRETLRALKYVVNEL